MANTIIQIKRSSTSTAPTPGSLVAAEQAYSFLSDKLFIGNTAGSGVIEIGGKYWVDTTQVSFDQANAAFEAANNASLNSNTGIAAAFLQANTARNHANAAFDQANTALEYAQPAIFTANAAIITANAAYDQANIATTNAGAAFDKANSANLLAFNTGAGANAYAQAVGAAGNNYTISVGAAANGWANTQAAGAKDYANNTFVKLTAPNQTITGDLSLVGNLIVSGNTTQVGVNELRVSDPLIYLAGNNYVSDIVDIGFIGNYVNATGSNVHTGLYREHEDKMYYLFQGYDAEPIDNHIGAFSNNMTLAVLNADLRTSNLWLGGANAIVTIGAAFDKANAANLLAFNTGIGANAYTVTVGAAANGWANSISATRSAASNAYAETIGAASNTYAQTVGTAGNNYTVTVGAAANGWANTISSTRAAASNAYAETIGAAANTNAGNASYISSGILAVAYGGTGVTSFTQNGILYGNTASSLKVTSAGTEGQVLQASSTGIPQFGDLDGGTF
jgi:hypothetical protein